MKQVKKAVIPVAGLGTRFLPMTKVVPKELLPIVDRPCLQYVIEEAVESGIETIVLVNSRGKESIEAYLTHLPDYEEKLKSMGKLGLLDELNKFIDQFDVQVAIQDEPKGLGHAIHCAKKVVGDEPFIILLPDVIIESKPRCSRQLIDAYNEIGCGVIYTEHTPCEQLGSYGVLDVESSKGPLHKLRSLVEKPRPENAPSDLTVVGRYLVPGSIFDLIEGSRPGHGGEIQLTDALTELARTEGLYALEHEAHVFDTGDKLGFMRANFYFGLKDKKFGDPLRKYLDQLK